MTFIRETKFPGDLFQGKMPIEYPFFNQLRAGLADIITVTDPKIPPEVSAEIRRRDIKMGGDLLYLNLLRYINMLMDIRDQLLFARVPVTRRNIHLPQRLLYQTQYG